MANFRPPRRFRFGLRTLFVVVAVVSIGFGGWKLKQRRDEFRKAAALHDDILFLDATILRKGQRSDSSERVKAYHAHHRLMREKYERAARYPWLPVEPDPPEPSPVEK